MPTQGDALGQEDERKLRDLVTDLLLTEDGRTLAAEARASFAKGVQSVKWKPTDTVLQRLCTQFDKDVLPIIERLQPSGTVSERIRSGLGRMLFVRFLENAACVSTPLRRLAQRYARDLISYGSRTFRLRTIVPFAAFTSEQEFTLSGKIGHEEYRCRFAKLNGRLPRFFGYYVYPGPADFAWPTLNDIKERTNWALIMDILATRDENGDVGRSDPSAHHVPSSIVTALRLFADGDVHYSRQYTTYQALHLSGSFITYHDSSGGLSPLNLTKAGLPEFKKLWKRLEPHLPLEKGLPPRLALAVDYFSSSYGKRAEAGFLDLHIALESLADVHTEHTYRLPLRVSALLAKTKSEAVSLADESKAYWEMRCKIAHGDKDIRSPKTQVKLRAQLPQLRALVRRLIHAHIQLFESDRRDVAAYEKSIKDFDTTHILTRGYRR